MNVYAVLLLSFFYISCRQNQTNFPEDDIKARTGSTVSSYGPNTMVRNIKKGRNGTILIASSVSGVYRYDGKSFTSLTSKVGPRRFWDVLEDRQGNLWFASTDSGVYYHNGKSLPNRQSVFQHFTTREGLVNDRVMSIYEDKSGVIWFGTGGGISRYDGKSFQNFTTKKGLPNNDITTIMEDKTGKLWIGTRGEACFYNGRTFTVIKNKDGKAFNNVWSIVEDKRGYIWFGAETVEDKKGDTLVVSVGLWRYDGRSYTKVSERSASAIIEDKKGNIWTTGSINPHDSSVWALSRYDQKSLYDRNPDVTVIISVKKMLCGIFEANDGSIWFGSMNGVYRNDGKHITDFKSKMTTSVGN